MNHYWTACHTQPGAEWKARKGIEEAGFGTFLPTYAKCWRIGRQVISRELPLMPGYVLIAIDPTDGSKIGEIHPALIEGMECLLGGKISQNEVNRLLNAHVLGSYNVVQVRDVRGRFVSAPTEPKKRRSRPRSVRSVKARRKRRALQRIGNLAGATNHVAA
jgi:hypothetical protein